MSESIQHKLDRVRPPRVQITYDVQIGDAFEVKELPLVVGVLADLSGQLPEGTVPPKLRDRQFVEIDRDSFREVFSKINPHSTFTVDNLMRVKADGAAEPPKLPIVGQRGSYPETGQFQAARCFAGEPAERRSAVYVSPPLGDSPHPGAQYAF